MYFNDKIAVKTLRSQLGRPNKKIINTKAFIPFLSTNKKSGINTCGNQFAS